MKNNTLMKLTWYANRLLSMGPEEVIYRLGNQVTIWRERSSANRPTHDYIHYPIPPEIFPGFKENGWWHFFFPSEKEDALRDQIQGIFPDGVRATLDAAEQLLKDQITLFGRTLQLDNPINWSKDPLTGNIWPQDFWAVVDVRDGQTIGGVKWVRELNRCHHFVTLGKAYWLSGEERYAEALRGHFTSWIKQNPPFVGVNWSSALGNAIRVINWIWAVNFIYRSPSLTEPLFGRIISALVAQTAFIGRHLSKYSSANNHLIGEAAGLAFVGFALPWLREANEWRGLGMNVLTNEIRKQIYPDGVPAEQTLNYLAFDLDFYLLVWKAAARYGSPIPAVWRERIGAACDFISHVIDEKGRVPVIGDSDDGQVVVLDERPTANRFRSILASAAVLLNRPGLKNHAGEWDEKSHWLLGQAWREKFDRMETRPVRLSSRQFKEGGYSLMRQGGRILLFDHGPLGYLSLAAHGHADALSLLLTVEGQPFLIDPGTFAYREGGKWRRYFRGTSAHNTIVVDGLDQSKMRGDFLWGRRASTRLLDWRTSDKFDRCSAEHDGYAHLNAIHRRTVSFYKPNWILIEDWLLGKGKHQIEQCWHFPIQAELDKMNGHFSIMVNNVAIQMLTDSALTVRVLKGEKNPIQGWVSKQYGRKAPAPVLLVSGTCFIPLKMTTLINMGQSLETAELISIRDRLKHD